MRCLVSCLIAALVALASVPAQSSPQTCGLGRDFHVGRRKALIAQLEGGIVVLRGLPGPRENLRFHQDKIFWYLTGVVSENVAATIEVATGKSTLFLPPQDRHGEMWEGEKWDAGDEWIKDLAGFDELRPIASFDAYLKERLAGEDKRVWTSLSAHITLAGSYDSAGPYDRRIASDPFDGRISREKAFAAKLAERYGAEVKDITGALNKLRPIKTAEELAALQRAADSAAAAMREAMRSTRPGLREYEVEAVLDLVLRRRGASGPGYQAIVGTGKNALVLHYSINSATLQDGDMLLVDYGPEQDCYVCDLTRSWPVNGKFSARQAELYDIVLAAQEAGIAEAKPGKGIADVERACDRVLQERGVKHLKRHGACHLVGMEVHDPGMVRGKLVPGVAFTIEPGLYEEETRIGIRIEDVVVITESGCDVITKAAPRQRAEIEALMAERGVLDAMDNGAK